MMDELTLLDLVRTFDVQIAACVMAGLVCPLVGCLLLVRRTSFYGIVLPQFGAAGVAFGYATLPWWVEHIGLGGMDLLTALESPHRVSGYMLTWAALFSFAALAALALPGGGQGRETGRLAAGFAIGSAATLIIALYSPTGSTYVESLLHGEVLGVSPADLRILGSVLGVVLVLLLLFQRDLLLVSFDRETARVLGKRVGAYELLFAFLVGSTVAASILTIGPIVLFGLLVVPPLAARRVARSMRSFYVWASMLGLVAALAGTFTSFELDWPLGPAVVAAAAAELALMTLVAAAAAPLMRRDGSARSV